MANSLSCQLRWVQVLLIAACLACSCTQAHAVILPFIPDEALAESRLLIVVARWPQSPIFAEKHGIRGRWTRIIIERVVRGQLKPGEYVVNATVMLTPDTKRPDGSPLLIPELPDEMVPYPDVRQPQLWFLSLRRASDGTEYLELPAITPRAIQALELEPYFQALTSANPTGRVARLLASDEPLVLLRSLQYFSGGKLPWPYEGRSRHHKWWPQTVLAMRLRKPRVEMAPAVGQLLHSSDVRVRRTATAVFAELLGPQSREAMRRLLVDRDPDTRAIAIGTLARYQDQASSQAICKAAIGISNGEIACQLIDLLSAWQNEEIAPALISLLQLGGEVYRVGDDPGVPAFKAQQALRRLTGVSFPTDVRSSQAAWEKAKRIADTKAREEFLRMTLKDQVEALTVVARRSGKGMIILVRNQSKQPVFLSRLPTYVNVISGGETTALRWHPEPEKKADFVELAPGESTRFSDSDLLESTGGNAKPAVRLEYLDNGSRFGINAWMGILLAPIQPE